MTGVIQGGGWIYVMFEKLTALFDRGLKTRGVAECPFVFRPDKTRAASFFERLQKHSTKSVSL